MSSVIPADQRAERRIAGRRSTDLATAARGAEEVSGVLVHYVEGLRGSYFRGHVSIFEAQVPERAVRMIFQNGVLPDELAGLRFIEGTATVPAEAIAAIYEKGILPRDAEAFRFVDKVVVTVNGERYVQRERYNPSGIYFIDGRPLDEIGVVVSTDIPGKKAILEDMKAKGVRSIVVTRSGPYLFRDEDRAILGIHIRADG